MGFNKGFDVDKYVGKVIDTSKPNQRRVKRVVSDNKVGLSILGGAVTTLAVGVGVLGTALFNKKKTSTYKKKIEELETENQRLEAMLIKMNNAYMSQLGIEVADLYEYEYDESDFGEFDFDFESVGEEDSSFEFPDFNDEEIVKELSSFSKFNKFQDEIAQSLEQDGDVIAPPYYPNQTIVFSEEELEEISSEDGQEAVAEILEKTKSKNTL